MKTTGNINIMDDCTPLTFLNSSGENINSSLFIYNAKSIPHNNISISSHIIDTHAKNSFPDARHDGFEHAERVLYQYIVPCICVLGIVGNLLNLVVLIRNLRKANDRLGKCAHVGLVAMAFSDALFCVSVLPHAWVPAKQFVYDTSGFSLVYGLYSPGVINTFIMSSTWLTVTISASRYFAIVHPLHAREVIGMTFTKCSMVITFLFCILFNLPRFWALYSEQMECTNGRTVFYKADGFFNINVTFQVVYKWIYFIIGIVLPVLILMYCNVYLIRALRHSLRMRQQYQSPSSASKQSANRITLTMIVIILMYITLVAPADILNFFKDMIISQAHMTPVFNLVVAILNTFQALNFAFSFVLYCVVNTHFRKAVAEMFCACGKERREKMATSSGWYESVSATTQV